MGSVIEKMPFLKKIPIVAEIEKLINSADSIVKKVNGKPTPENTNGEIKEPEGGDW